MKYLIRTLEFGGIGRIDEETFSFDNKQDVIQKHKELKEKYVSSVTIYQEINIKDLD